MSFFKRKDKKELEREEIIVAYGDAVGIVDIWECAKIKRRFDLKRQIIVAKKNPTDKVHEEAQKEGIEIVVALENPKKEAKRLAESLSDKEGKEVKVKRIEDMVDRSFMLDPF